MRRITHRQVFGITRPLVFKADAIGRIWFQRTNEIKFEYYSNRSASDYQQIDVELSFKNTNAANSFVNWAEKNGYKKMVFPPRFRKN